MPGDKKQSKFATIEDLVSEGQSLPSLEALQWSNGQGSRQTAFLCYSSGTTGLPVSRVLCVGLRCYVSWFVDSLQKAAMISHRNVIANVLSQVPYEAVARKSKGIETQVALGLLPFSHIYALVVIAHTGVWRGDGTIVLPRFELETFLEAIQKYKIEQISVVSPVVSVNSMY